VVDLTDSSDPLIGAAGLGDMPEEYQDCLLMREAVFELQDRADHTALQGSYAPTDITFIDGDVDLNASDSGEGILVVTGTLTIDGNVDWTGMIIVVGEGSILRNGGGSGLLSGAIVVADVSGPDGIFGNADDCENGFESPDFVVNGNGNADIEFCSTAVANANPLESYRIEEFIQR